MNRMQRTVGMMIVVAIAGAFSITGCEKQGTAEQAGEEVDRAVDEAKDAVKDATN